MRHAAFSSGAPKTFSHTRLCLTRTTACARALYARDTARAHQVLQKTVRPGAFTLREPSDGLVALITALVQVCSGAAVVVLVPIVLAAAVVAAAAAALRWFSSEMAGGRRS